MPFNKSGIWLDPTKKDLEDFRRQLTEKDAVISEVTPAMMKAITTGLTDGGVTTQGSEDLFTAISKISGAVDIVIPVYAGLHVLAPCINSILARTNWPHRLIIVDDCSPDPVTKEYLERLKAGGTTVLFNNANRGFASTVNRGVNAGENPYVVVLNSDTLVTENWLPKMVVAMEADPLNVIVNPATNNTAMINVNMYPGTSYLDMASAMTKINTISYPIINPTGFCFMFRRALWNVIGPLDEAYVSYGEESDFWFKAIRLVDEEGCIAGYKAVAADNAYVYHERGTSFQQIGNTQHKQQRAHGSDRFKALHPQYGEWAKGYNAEEAIGHLRTGIPTSSFKGGEYKGNVAWVVKSAGPCGGMYFITDIVNQMIEEGYNVKVCVIPHAIDTVHEVVGNLHTQPILFQSVDDFAATFEQRVFSEGVVFAAVTELTPAIFNLTRRNAKLKCFNHVQSWDVALADLVGRPELREATEMSYRALPNVVSSGWVAQQIKNIGGTVAAVVNPGVNSFLWHNRYREKHDDRFTVAVMLLQNYPYKGANRGTEYCRQLTEVIKENNLNIKLMAIGIDALPTIPGVTCVGGLSLSKLADVLGNEVDLLVDPAILHSYGLPALEALVSGCHAITFENHGVHEYAKAWGDRIRVVETEEQAVAETLLFATRHQNGELDQLDRTISRQQVEEHSRARAIDKFIDSVFPAPTPVRSLHIEVVTPHLRKHGGPTTNIMLANSLIDIGHKVTMSMIHTDWNPEVLKMSKAKVRTKWQKMPSGCDVVIINSDNPYAEEIMTLNPGRKYIMYKLSHNARFKIEEQNTLNLPWDHIITSTQWLKDACLTLQPEWEHKVWSDDKVTVVGWYHYGHKVFECNPHNRNYGTIEAGFRAGTLIHQHPLKGSIDALASFTGLKKKYGNFFHAVGIGEVPKAKLPPWAQYLQSPNRVDMAHILRQVDIWLGASHTEGLGRMALEAMSAGTAVVTTDTGAEFLKHEENCLLYPINNPQAGAEAVDRLITDQKLMTRLVINAFDTACRAADPTRFKAQIEKIVMEVYDA